MVAGIGDYPKTLGGRYHLLAIVGTGAMGQVWRTYDDSLRRHVACKVISGPIAGDRIFRERFQREARHAASLSHPNIVRVFDSGASKDASFIIMEFVEGSSLREVLGASERLSVAVTANLALNVLAGLGHAHDRGIVHRDIKPANLLIGVGGVVKLADFGIAKSLSDAADLTAQGVFVGTASYASPEQLGSGDIDSRSDLYSLGCVMYQCLTGRSPLNTEHLQQLEEVPPVSAFRSDVPESISEAIRKSMARQPSHRFTTAADMAEALATFGDPGALSEFFDAATLTRYDNQTSHDQSITVPGRPLRTSGSDRTKTLNKSATIHQPPTSHRRRWSVRTVTIAAIVLALAMAFAISEIAGVFHGPPIDNSRIHSGGFLRPGHSISSTNGEFKLVMQRDGNLVEYSRHQTLVEWESDTSGHFDAYVVMQSDGDLVVYPKGDAAPTPDQPTTALWSSGTGGHRGASLLLLNNGQAEVQAHHTHAMLWQSLK